MIFYNIYLFFSLISITMMDIIVQNTKTSLVNLGRTSGLYPLKN